MKRLRNIGVYYTGLTLFSVLLSVWGGLLLFKPLLPFGVIGIVCLLLYAFMKRNRKNRNKKENKWAKKYRGVINSALYLLTFLFYVAVIWYVHRPYKQTIVLPQGYEGVVAVQYDKPNGQPKQWIGGFLGFGASRFIKVDSTGVAETQFTFHNNAIALVGAKQDHYNEGGLKIYYENDLLNEIVPGADGSYRDTYENPTKGEPDIYFTGFSQYPLFIFVVTQPENYHHYFMTEKEIEAWMEQRKKKSRGYVERPRHKLNTKYEHYYRFKEYYYNKLNKR